MKTCMSEETIDLWLGWPPFVKGKDSLKHSNLPKYKVKSILRQLHCIFSKAQTDNENLKVIVRCVSQIIFTLKNVKGVT